jgi:Zn-dependent M28 family amino/carboxypeptidase
LITFCALLGVAHAIRAQSFDAKHIAAAQALRDRALQDATAYEVVSGLTTEVGPRAAGTPQDAAAVAWAVAKLRQLGFSNVRTMEVIVPRWVRGEARFSVVSPYPQSMPTLALGGSIGTVDGGLEAGIVMVRDFDALAALPAGAVAGKIVFFNGRTERTRDGSGYGRAVRVRSGGPSAAAQLGAVGVVIRSIGTSNNRFPHTGTTNYSIGAPRIPAVAISNPDADALERQIASGKPVTANMIVTARDLPQVRSANVIGEIPGTDPNAEIVLLGAHLDSWDPGTGALDDGAGVAIVVAAAKLIRETVPRPRRTIRVVLFANEEFGLSGSLGYATQIGDELARHAIGLEADFGAGPVYELRSRVPTEYLPAIDAMHSVLAALGIARGNNEATGGADLAPLRRQGMPLLEPELDGTYYFDVHHTANDTLDQIKPEHLRQSVAAFAVSAYLAAQYAPSWGRMPTPPEQR